MGGFKFDSRWVCSAPPPTCLYVRLNFDCSVAHVDQVHRLAWQFTDEPTERQLASCSEDGTLKILVVHVDV